MTEGSLRWLARCAMHDFPGTRGDGPPRWIAELASLPPPNFHALDQLMHAGLILWRNGWRVTDAGWRALEAAIPEEALQ